MPGLSVAAGGAGRFGVEATTFVADIVGVGGEGFWVVMGVRGLEARGEGGGKARRCLGRVSKSAREMGNLI